MSLWANTPSCGLKEPGDTEPWTLPPAAPSVLSLVSPATCRPHIRPLREEVQPPPNHLPQSQALALLTLEVPHQDTSHDREQE